MMRYVAEFARWHAAPADERDQIVKHQIATFDDIIGSLAPDLAALQNHPEDVVMWNYKLGRDCSSDDLEAMAAWFRQLRRRPRQRELPEFVSEGLHFFGVSVGSGERCRAVDAAVAARTGAAC